MKITSMNKIEVIEIRTQHETKHRLEVELQKLLTEVNNVSGKMRIRIYSRLNLETDYVILILNEGTTSEGEDPKLGIRLNEALKDFGMVNYSKWQELTSTKMIFSAESGKAENSYV
jgi:hypothetical protein